MENNTQTKTKLIPKLRFKEFEGEWEQKKLGELSNKVSYGMNSAAIAFDGKHKYLRITDIDENTREFLAKPLTSPDGLIEDKFKMKLNDIVFARTGASTGKSYLYKPSDGDLYYAGFLIKFNISKANSYFIYAQTFRESYNKWVQVYSMRSGQPGLNAEEYKNLKLKIPSLKEQQKIATFLTAVDTKIQQLGQKKELLANYKKGVMQQLFSQQLRFKPDSNKTGVIANDSEAISNSNNEQTSLNTKTSFPDWEEKRLGEMAYITTGSSNRVDSSLNGEYTFFDRSEDIRTSSIFLFDAEAIIVPGEGQKFTPKYFIGKFDLHQRSYAIMNFDNCEGKFIFYYIAFHTNYLLSQAVGSTVKSLRLPMFKKMKINFPSLKEQQKIANYLSALDKKIENVQTQIDKTQGFKKGLLQQMFV